MSIPDYDPSATFECGWCNRNAYQAQMCDESFEVNVHGLKRRIRVCKKCGGILKRQINNEKKRQIRSNSPSRRW